MNGRMLAGTRVTIATHQPAESTSVPSAPNRCRNRVPIRRGEA